MATTNFGQAMDFWRKMYVDETVAGAMWNGFFDGETKGAPPAWKQLYLDSLTSSAPEFLYPKHVEYCPSLPRDEWLKIKTHMEYISAMTGERVIIAGGMPRDIGYNIPYKDVDIYVPNCKDYKMSGYLSDYYSYLHNLSTASKSAITTKTLSGSDGYEDDEIIHVEETKIDGITYNLMFIKGEIVDHVRDVFDLSICKAIIASDGSIYYLPEFLKTVETGKVTFTRGISAEDKVRSYQKHWPRIKRKLPHLELVLNKVNKGRPL